MRRKSRIFLEIVRSNNEQLLRLINDVLDLSKIEAGTLEYVYANVDINKMVSEIEQATSIRLTNKDVRLVTVTPLPGFAAVYRSAQNYSGIQ